MIKKISALASSSAVAAAIDLASSMILSRALLPEGIGQVALIVSLGAIYAAFSNFGIGQAYIYLLNSKGYAIDKVLKNCLGVTLVCCITGFLVSCIILTKFTDYFGEYSDTLLVVISLGIASSLGQTFIRPLLIAQFKIKQVSLFTIGLSFITFIIIAIVFLLDQSLLTVDVALSIQTLSKVVIFLLMLAYLVHDIPEGVGISFSYFKESLSEGKKFYFSFLMTQILLQGSVFGLQFYELGFSEVGLYSRAMSLTLLMTIIPYSIGPLLYSRWSGLETSLAAKELVACMSIYLLGLSFICPIVIFLSKDLLQFVYGRAFVAAADLFSILVLGIAFKILSDPLINYLASRGKVQINGYLSLIGAFSMLSIIYWFTPSMGAKGIAVSVVVSSIVIFIGLLLVVIKYLFKESSPSKIFRIDFIGFIRSLK